MADKPSKEAQNASRGRKKLKGALASADTNLGIVAHPKKVREVRFQPAALKDLRRAPKKVREEAGIALEALKNGADPACAKTLTGYGSSKVKELVLDHSGDTYRAVLTLEYEGLLWVVAFYKKKSHQSGEVPKEIEKLIRKRLKDISKS